MTYRRLFDLKFKQKVPTIELEKRFPSDRNKIAKLAFLELPITVLKSVVKDQKKYLGVLALKKKLLGPC